MCQKRQYMYSCKCMTIGIPAPSYQFCPQNIEHQTSEFGGCPRGFEISCSNVGQCFQCFWNTKQKVSELGAEINPPSSAAKVDEMGMMQRSSMLIPYKGGVRMPGFDEVPSSDLKELRICY